MVSVVCLVPRLPPATDGVGDYALNLARQLLQEHDIQTHFIVCDYTWTGAKQIDNFPISQLSISTPQALSSLLLEVRANIILLHYVGYGYAKRGCPSWLIDGLKNWCTIGSHRKLVTMFHEVYAAGNPPWTSSFWLFWLQKKLATDLVRLSDRILTNKQRYAKILFELSSGKHRDIAVMPVFSNIGEPEHIRPLLERQPLLVIFGGKSKRTKAYSESGSKIKALCQKLEIEKIIDIGPSIELSLSDLDGVSIKEMGKLPTEEIGQIFSDCRVGFLDYNPDFLAKSGIFAAYCAYGMLPVNAWSGGSSIDGIESGRHYWIAREHYRNTDSPNQIQAIADNARTWYQTHSLPLQAQTFATHLQLSRF